MKQYINSKKIQAFVTKVETKKKFKRDTNLIFRHLVEEVGECSRALWHYELFCTTGMKSGARKDVAKELVDIISLCVYLADVLHEDLNEIFPIRIREIAKQYMVNHKE